MELLIENGTLLKVNHCDAYVRLPEEVETIGFGAFKACENLETIVLPQNLKRIEGRAFDGCRNLKKIDLPDGLIKLGFWAFRRCTSLVHVTLPDVLRSVEENLFEGCTSLETVHLPENAGIMQKDIFYGCENLRSVDFPDHLFMVDAGIFYGCRNLVYVKHPEDAKFDYSKQFFDEEAAESVFRHQCVSLNRILVREWKVRAAIWQIHAWMDGRYREEEPKHFPEYREYIGKHRGDFYPEFYRDMKVLEYFCQQKLIPEEAIGGLIEESAKKHAQVSARLLEYQKQCFGMEPSRKSSFDLELEAFLDTELDF